MVRRRRFSLAPTKFSQDRFRNLAELFLYPLLGLIESMLRRFLIGHALNMACLLEIGNPGSRGDQPMLQSD
jgi:hypothetical protein